MASVPNFPLFVMFVTGNVYPGLCSKRLLIDSSSILIQLQEEVQQLKSAVTSLQHENKVLKNHMGGSSTYVRWGRPHCPAVNGTILVYSGVAGGSRHTTHGGGVNPMCLPHDPSFLSSSQLTQDGYADATMYGAEYQFNYGKIAIDDDVPCAVCYVPATVLMIPARNTCPPGWTIQYSGILTADSDQFSPSEYLLIALLGVKLRPSKFSPIYTAILDGKIIRSKALRADVSYESS
ncbi:uncharacterized protein LOC133181141 [Saccostrea echinata]|uniref:uncharacterized protein LOC133181141 n=1 Tax=Saccostrea echinata TaxID=191078 RepID=UPI002A7F66D2|nr:uncharacterized protein LOC133181141 [Saccostrea echinata]